MHPPESVRGVQRACRTPLYPHPLHIFTKLSCLISSNMLPKFNSIILRGFFTKIQ